MNHSWRDAPFLLLALCGLAWALPGALAQAAEPRAFRPVNASPAPAPAEAPLRWKKPNEDAVQQTAASERVATRSTRELPAPTHPAALDSSVAFGDGGPVSVAPHGQYFDPGYPGHPGHPGHPGYYGEGAPCGCDDGGGCYDACCPSVSLPALLLAAATSCKFTAACMASRGRSITPALGIPLDPIRGGGNFGYEGFNIGLPICGWGTASRPKWAARSTLEPQRLRVRRTGRHHLPPQHPVSAPWASFAGTIAGCKAAWSGITCETSITTPSISANSGRG